MSVLPILPQGFVVGRILNSRGDSADADKLADTAVVVGMVDFTPATAYRKLDAATVVTHSKITAKLDSHGDLHPQREPSDNTGSDTEDGIWLPVGTWKVTYRLNVGFGALPEHNIEVTTAHTEAAPLPLFANMGDAPVPGATYVQLTVPLGGQQGQVLVMNDGSLAWGDVEGGVGGVDSEAVQDIVGAMVTAAGGTYDDAAGTITLPAGGASTVESVNTVAAATGATALPGVETATVHDITMTGNVTIGLPTDQPAGACSMTVVLRQDATGARAVIWPSNIAWPNAIAPVASTAPGSVTVVALWTLDGGATWFGTLAASNMTPAGAPPAPTTPGAAQSVSAAADADSINVTWEPASANGATITSYKVYRGTTAGTLSLLATKSGTTYAHDDNTAVAGTMYYYAVSAVNSVGEGPQSTVASAKVTVPGGFTLFAADDFNRPDTTAGNPGKPADWTTLAWQPGANNAYITGNQLAGGAPDLWLDAGTGDVAVEARLLTSWTWVIVRGVSFVTNAWDYYQIGTDGTRLVVYERTGTGTPTVILEGASAPLAAPGALFRVEAVGTSIKVFVNGSQVYQFTDTTKQTATKHGLSMSGNYAHHDDFKLYTA